MSEPLTLAELRTIWRMAKGYYHNNCTDLRDVFRGYVQDEIYQRTIAAQAERITDLEQQIDAANASLQAMRAGVGAVRVMSEVLTPNTIECCLSALRVIHESLSEPSEHFSAEIQRAHQAEIDVAMDELNELKASISNETEGGAGDE